MDRFLGKFEKCSGIKKSVQKEGSTTQVPTVRKAPSVSVRLAQIASFSALIAAGTILSNALLGIALPPPLLIVTVAPAFYFTISVLYPRTVSFWSTAIGSAIGLAISIFVFFPIFAPLAPIFIPGIVWARAPETLIIYQFRRKSAQWVAFSMALATVYETLAFFFPDWFFYAYGFLPGGSRGVEGGLALALLDLGTFIDLVWIPVALILIRAVRKAFNVQFFE